MTKSERTRINLSVDPYILDLVKKWSYISGLPVSTLFDKLFERETRRFKYESEEAWEASEEYEEYINEQDPNFLFHGPILDVPPREIPNFSYTDEELKNAGIEVNEDGKLEISSRYPNNGKKLERLFIRKVRGKEYYSRWKEVCGDKK